MFRVAHVGHCHHRRTHTHALSREGSKVWVKTQSEIRMNICMRTQTDKVYSVQTKSAQRETRKLILHLVFDWNN